MKDSRKWKKYKLLPDLGIREWKEFERALHRFPVEDIDKCFMEIGDELGKTSCDLHYANLISPTLLQGNPSAPIRNEQEFSKAWEKLRALKETGKYSEVWHWRNKQRDAVQVRQRFVIDKMFPRIAPSRLEVVDVNIRDIEQYPDVKSSYCAFEKKDRAYPFELKEKILKAGGGELLDEKLQGLTLRLAKKQKQFLEFGELLKGCGARCFSMEAVFTKEDGLIVNDWDSDNDKKVMDVIEHLGI